MSSVIIIIGGGDPPKPNFSDAGSVDRELPVIGPKIYIEGLPPDASDLFVVHTLAEAIRDVAHGKISRRIGHCSTK